MMGLLCCFCFWLWCYYDATAGDFAGLRWLLLLLLACLRLTWLKRGEGGVTREGGYEWGGGGEGGEPRGWAKARDAMCKFWHT